MQPNRGSGGVRRHRAAGLLLLPLLLALLVLVALSTAPLAFADTAPPPTGEESNGLILAVLALGALAAIVVLNRPRRGGPP